MMKGGRWQEIRDRLKKAADDGKSVFIAASSEESAQKYRDTYFPGWYVIGSDNVGSVEAMYRIPKKTYGVSNVKL